MAIKKIETPKTYKNKKGYKYTIMPTLDNSLSSVFYQAPEESEKWYRVMSAPLTQDIGELNDWFNNFVNSKNLTLAE